MKTRINKIIALVLAAMMCCVLLSACGISESDAVGTWSGTYVYDGNNFAVAFILSADGEYSKATVKNGEVSSTETGVWEIDGGKVVLHKDGNFGVSTEYKFKGGALVNNDHEFYKD